MNDLVGLGLYELVTNHPPPPVGSLLAKLSSKHACRTYRGVIDFFLAWIERDPFRVDSVVIENYKGEMLGYNRPALVALRLRIIRELYQEALDTGLVSRNPAACVAPPSFTPDPYCALPAPDVATARLASCNRSLEAGRCDYALCLLSIQTAIEPDQVPALKVADFRSEEGKSLLWVRQRLSSTPVPMSLSEDLGQALDEYLAGREVADDSPLFSLLCSPGHGAGSYSPAVAG